MLCDEPVQCCVAVMGIGDDKRGDQELSWWECGLYVHIVFSIGVGLSWVGKSRMQ